MNEWFGAALFPVSSNFTMLVGRLVLNLLVTGIIVRVYYRLYRNRDYIFTYLLLNLLTFSLAYLLSSVPIELGFALGLFAVFGILRYRTEAIQVRDLTYLFVVIGIALLNALTRGGISLTELLVVNGVIAGTVGVLEAAPFSGREESRLVRYDRLELLGPATAAELLDDLRKRTHLPVERYEIGNVDLLTDCADITIHYRPARPKVPLAPGGRTS
jgi:hypothetical protein